MSVPAKVALGSFETLACGPYATIVCALGGAEGREEPRESGQPRRAVSKTCATQNLRASAFRQQASCLS